MEAALIEGSSGLFGGISCIRGFKNPVLIAKQLLLFQKTGLRDGLIKPQHVCGEGAQAFALSHHFSQCDDLTLLTQSNRKQHTRYLRFCEDNCNFGRSEGKIGLMDTVGAVCVDEAGDVASGASSGGLAFRPEGRIGHVSLPSGSGVWVDSDAAVGACTTGVGELIARDLVARKACELFVSDSHNFSTSLELLFKSIRCRKSCNNWPCLFGGLCVQSQESGPKTVACFITGMKLLVAFASSRSPPRVHLLDSGQTHESPLVVQQWFL